MSTSRVDAKHLVDRAMSSRPATRALTRATYGTATIFVLHRIRGTGADHEGIDRSLIEATLRRLRADGFRFASLRELVTADPAHLAGRRRTVAFTADDGYHDQADVLAPLLAEFDCPLTIFLTTGFLDGDLVPWWDRVGAAITGSRVAEVRVSVGSEDLQLAVSDDPVESVYAFLRVAKRADDAARRRAIEALVDACRADVPDRPFGRFRPMTWDAARRLEATGLVDFGPHTVHHPILARLPADEVRPEIEQSWARLRTELADPLPVFCYPNGAPGDFGVRERQAVRDAGLQGAVRVGGAPVRVADLADPTERFQLARTPFPHTLAGAVRRANGTDQLRATAARLRAARREPSQDDLVP